jgi:pimeloyl-ACP methyl ester carboxylesterase
MGHPDLTVDHVGQRAAGEGPPEDVRGGEIENAGHWLAEEQPGGGVAVAARIL